MKFARIILAIVMALSISIAPVGSAWAALRVAAAKAATQTGGISEMSDCERMMRGTDEQPAGKSDCPCCDFNAACTPDLCLGKCFQHLGTMPRPAVIGLVGMSRPWLAEVDPPPDWSYRPPPPPPRT